MPKCKKGEIVRKGGWVSGYYRSDGTYVKEHYRKAVCVKDVGLRGKTPKSKRVLPPLEKGGLGKYGYANVKKTTANSRRKALSKGVKKEGYLPIMRRLVLVANYNKNSDPEAHKRMRADVEWMKRVKRANKFD